MGAVLKAKTGRNADHRPQLEWLAKHVKTDKLDNNIVNLLYANSAKSGFTVASLEAALRSSIQAFRSQTGEFRHSHAGFDERELIWLKY